jgi:hypothetical protein
MGQVRTVVCQHKEAVSSQLSARAEALMIEN